MLRRTISRICSVLASAAGAFLAALGLSGRVLAVGGVTVRVGRLIGEGGFSYVYEATNIKTHERYALKKMVAMELRQYEVYLLFPLYEAGSVQGLIDRHKRASSEPPFGERLCRSIFRGVCEGLREFHTHSPPWAHRDIKPANILVAPSRNFEPCLTDFGSAAPGRIDVTNRVEAQQAEEAINSASTPYYRSPETFNISYPTTIDERIDVWALGCVLYAMAFGVSPFEEQYLKGGSLALATLSGNWAFPQQRRNFSESFCNLISFMLDTNVATRPTIIEVLDRLERLDGLNSRRTPSEDSAIDVRVQPD